MRPECEKGKGESGVGAHTGSIRGCVRCGLGACLHSTPAIDAVLLMRSTARSKGGATDRGVSQPRQLEARERCRCNPPRCLLDDCCLGLQVSDTHMSIATLTDEDALEKMCSVETAPLIKAVVVGKGADFANPGASDGEPFMLQVSGAGTVPKTHMWAGCCACLPCSADASGRLRCPRWRTEPLCTAFIHACSHLLQQLSGS